MEVIVVIGLVVVLLLGIASKIRRARYNAVVTLTQTGEPSATLETNAPQGASPDGGSSKEPAKAAAKRSTRVDPQPIIRTGLVTVFESFDSAEVLVAKSLLEAADIPFYAKGEATQDLIGHRLWGGSNFAIGPVALQVPAELAADARSLFEDQDESS